MLNTGSIHFISMLVPRLSRLVRRSLSLHQLSLILTPHNDMAGRNTTSLVAWILAIFVGNADPT